MICIGFCFISPEPRVPSPFPVTLPDTAPKILIPGSILSRSDIHLTPRALCFQLNKGQTIRHLGGRPLSRWMRGRPGEVNASKALDLPQQAGNDALEKTFPFLFGVVDGYL